MTNPRTKHAMNRWLNVLYMYHKHFLYSGLLCDLLWSDPDKEVQGWGENDRGVSFTFGADVVSKFLNRHDLDLICRAHQVSALCWLQQYCQLWWERECLVSFISLLCFRTWFFLWFKFCSFVYIWLHFNLYDYTSIQTK